MTERAFRLLTAAAHLGSLLAEAVVGDPALRPDPFDSRPGAVPPCAAGAGPARPGVCPPGVRPSRRSP